jgi:hypothetical protein
MKGKQGRARKEGRNRGTNNGIALNRIRRK